MNITDKKRKRALLLHYAGEATNEIFDTLPDTTPGEGEDTFEKALQALDILYPDEKEYRRLPNCPKLEPCSVKI